MKNTSTREIQKLENQLCFPFYALSRKITSMYQPFLNKLGITYPQYLVMLVLWEHEVASVKQIGELLFLDSGTLTPLLKRLEKNDLVIRKRSDIDERIVLISLTEEGLRMKGKAAYIPLELANQIKVDDLNLSSLQTSMKSLMNSLNINEG